MKLGIGIGVSASRRLVSAAPSFPNTYSLDFSVDDYVDIGLDKPATLNLTGEMTISAWINLDTVAAGTKIIVADCNVSASISQFAFEVNRTAGKLSALAHGAAVAVTSTTALSISTWYHVVLTRSGSTGSWDYIIYLDGVNDGSAHRADNPNAQQGCAIGRFGQSSSGYFDGNIDEVSIWNTALSAADVATLATAPSNLKTALGTTPVAWWRMGDSGTYFNSIWELPDQMKLDNYSKYSMEFDGVDDYVTTPAGPTISGDSTISFWMRLDATQPTTDVGFIASANYWTGSSPNNYVIQWRSNSKVRIVSTDGTTPYVAQEWTPPSFVADTWYHVCIIMDYTDASTSEATVYWNGVQIAGALACGGQTFADSSNGLTIGSYSIGGATPVYEIQGFMDEISIFDEIKTPSALYNSGKPSDLSAESGLVAYYKMGEGATFSTNWTIPDDSVNSNDGTSVNMTIADRATNAPDNINQADSVNMEEADRVTDVPT